MITSATAREPSEFQDPIAMAKDLFERHANLYAGNTLVIEEGVDPAVALGILKAAIKSYDAIIDPDFERPLEELNRRNNLIGEHKQVISITDLGLLGNIVIGQLPNGTHYLLNTSNITALTCFAKDKIRRELEQNLTTNLQEFPGTEFQLQDQYEEFLYLAYSKLAPQSPSLSRALAACVDDDQRYDIIDDFVNSKINSYKTAPGASAKLVMQEMTNELLEWAKDQRDQDALNTIYTKLQISFNRGGWINPATIPEERLERLIRFSELAARESDKNTFQGATVRSDPIAKYGPLYRAHLRAGNFKHPVGTYRHGVETEEFFKANGADIDGSN